MLMNPPNGTWTATRRTAVRSMFESLEILVRQMVPQARNLHKKLVETVLKEKRLVLYASEPTASQVVSELFDGFADWVNPLHNYRHGQPSEQPVAPTIEVAVYVLSSGSAFLRWLIGMNNDLKTRRKTRPPQRRHFRGSFGRTASHTNSERPSRFSALQALLVISISLSIAGSEGSISRAFSKAANAAL